MTKMAKAFATLLLLTTVLCSPGWAAGYTVIVGTTSGTSIKTITDAYDGKVLDVLDSQTYLLQLNRLTPKYAVTGIAWMEANRGVGPSKNSGAVLSVSVGTTADWYNKQPAFELIHRSTAMRFADGSGVVIADINSMTDYSHPALRNHLTGGYDFVTGQAMNVILNQSTASFLDQSTASFLDQSTASFLDQSTASFLDQSTASFLDQSTASFLDSSNPAHGHGTLVAGILAAIAPGAAIMPIRAFDDRGQSDEYTIAKAIQWATDHGANVINMSFGTTDQSSVIHNAIHYAAQEGVVLISSAGNADTNAQQFPAAYGEVIAVAATDIWDMKASFSNFGAQVSVSAPGVSIIAPYPDGHYAVVSGTSFASPIVAGEAALMISRLRQQKVQDRLKSSIVKIDQRNPGIPMGQGRIDLALAIANGAAASGTANTGTTSSAQPLTNGNACNGVYSGVLKGNLNVTAGQSCIILGGAITGNVQTKGGRLVLGGVLVGGNVQIDGSLFSIGPMSAVNGNVEAQNLPHSVSTSQICGTAIRGSLLLNNNAAPVQLGAASEAACAGNVILNSVTVRDNAGATDVYDNVFAGGLNVVNNSGKTEIFENAVMKTLQCQGNIAITGRKNQATQTLGQCQF